MTEDFTLEKAFAKGIIEAFKKQNKQPNEKDIDGLFESMKNQVKKEIEQELKKNE